MNHITNRTVYSLDGRNHGESPHTNEMTFALMAKDVRNFCEQNNHEKISFMGKQMSYIAMTNVRVQISTI